MARSLEIDVDYGTGKTKLQDSRWYSQRVTLGLQPTASGGWSAINPLTVMATDIGHRDLQALIAEYNMVREAIGKSRDASEVLRRFVEVSEFDTVEVRRPYGDYFKDIPKPEITVEGILSNPQTELNKLAEYRALLVAAYDSHNAR